MMPHDNPGTAVKTQECESRRRECAGGIRWAIRILVMILLALISITLAAILRYTESQAQINGALEARIRNQETAAARTITRQDFIIGQLDEIKAQTQQILKEVREP